MLWTLEFSVSAGQSLRTSQFAFSNELAAQYDTPEALRPPRPQQQVQSHALVAKGGSWGPNGMVKRLASEGPEALGIGHGKIVLEVLPDHLRFACLIQLLVGIHQLRGSYL